MTHTEQKTLPLGVGDDVKYYDDGTDGHPMKWVNGTVISAGSEGFTVKWEDLEWETEYEWARVVIEGTQLFEKSLRKEQPLERGLAFKQFKDEGIFP